MTAHELARALRKMPADYVVLVSTYDGAAALVLADPALTVDPMNGYIYLDVRAQMPADGATRPTRLTLWQRIRLVCGF